MTAASLTGRCVCGAITFRIDGPPRPVWNCHCLHCRRFTGHFMAATGCADDDLVIDDDTTLVWHAPNEHCRHGFCGTCGSSLFWQGTGRAGWTSVCAGPLDPPTGLTTAGAMFSHDASDYHTLDRDLPEVPDVPAGA